MITGIGYRTYLFFACCIVLALVFAYLFVPETKGVAMEAMYLTFWSRCFHLGYEGVEEL
jgi:hypothetical protein